MTVKVLAFLIFFVLKTHVVSSQSQGSNPYFVYYNSNCTDRNSNDFVCCHRPPIVPTSIRIYFLTRRTDNDSKPWQLDALISWEPSEDGDYSYAVRFQPTVTLAELDAMDGSFINTNRYGFCRQEDEIYSESCNSEPYFNRVVNETSLLVEDILFGFPYELLLQSIFNGQPSISYYCFKSCNDILPETVAPDCYESTNDDDFCREYPVPISGAPTNVEIETNCPSGNITAWTISLSWDPPVHQRGEIVRYAILAYQLEVDGPSEVYDNSFIPKLANEHNTTYFYDIKPFDRYSKKNGFQSNNEYTIKVFAYVKLSIEFNVTSLQRGSEAIRIIRTYESDWCPTTPTTSTAAKLETKPTRSNPKSMETSPESSESLQNGSNPIDAPTQVNVAILIVIVLVSLLMIITFVFLVNRAFCQGKQRNLDGENTRFVRKTNYNHGSKESEANVPIEMKGKEVTNRGNLEVEIESVGRGQYGDVYRGTLIGVNGKMVKTIVAIKTPKADASMDLKEDFLDEIKLMIDIGEHPHIMPLYGCCTITEPYYLITEFMKYGALDKFLLRCRSVENATLDPIYNLKELNQVQIAWQISKGMAFLSTTKFFHGDLAARNCLVGTNLLVKISDFGLSDDIYQSGYKRIAPEKKRPVKWYSPEANLDGVCSTKGDVWSFGVVMWEIYTFGDIPYPGMPATEVIKRIVRGYRLSQPDGCPLDIYKVMSECWQKTPRERPTFLELEYALELILHHRAEQDIRVFNGDLEETAYLPMEKPTAIRKESSLAKKINLSDILGTSADSAISDVNNTSSASFVVDNNLVGEPATVEPIVEETWSPSGKRSSQGSFDIDPELLSSDSDSIIFINILDKESNEDKNECQERAD